MLLALGSWLVVLLLLLLQSSVAGQAVDCSPAKHILQPLQTSNAHRLLPCL